MQIIILIFETFWKTVFILAPIAALVYFIVSLVRFCRAKKKNKQELGTYTRSEMLGRKIHLIVSSVLLVLILTIVFGLIWLVYMVSNYM